MSDEKHTIRQEPPWPVSPRSTYMLSRFRCSCGWTGSAFKYSRGTNATELSREAANEHVLKSDVSETGEQQ